MREIKFRGKVDGQWWYATFNDSNEGEWEQFWALVDRKTVGQWTGITDQNNKPVYEGDIVKWSTYPENPKVRAYIREVQWSDTEARFKPDGMGDDPVVEVIGNIYENPDLLERKP